MNSKKQILLGMMIALASIGAMIYALSPKHTKKDLLFSRPLPSQPSTQSQSEKRSDPLYPSQIIDLSSWKLTVPIPTADDPSQPLDIRQPELASYRLDPWFVPAPNRDGIVFRAPVNAATTSNSSYPRSELREMTADGSSEIAWSTKSGTHTLLLDEAITAVPKNKPAVVAGQIHGDNDDLLVIRLEYPKLFIAHGKSNAATLDENYALGKRFTIKFVANDGKIAVYYNNDPSPVYTLEKKVNEAYFKAGVYTQSNCQTEDFPELCAADNYGEVVIYRAQVTHR